MAFVSISPRSFRGTSPGHPLANPPVLWDIESEPALAGTKLIAEAWDAAGLYQVGSFVGDAGRNGTADSATMSAASVRGDDRHRSRPLRPIRWQPGSLRPQGARSRSKASTSSPATTVSRSTIWFPTTRSTTKPTAKKIATARNDNCSWNCGVEGPTDDAEIEQLRNRQIKNLLAVDSVVDRHADDSDGR